jgi:ribosome maturation factor RimP
MRNIIAQIESLALTIAEQEGLTLVDVVFRGKHNNHVLEVFVDSETGVTTEKCASVSRQLSRELDLAEIVQGRYTLVVSSPGVERPLKLPMQYRKNIGRKMELIVQDGTLTKKIIGKLVNCTEAEIEMNTDDSLSQAVPYNTIVRAKVMLPW